MPVLSLINYGGGIFCPKLRLTINGSEKFAFFSASVKKRILVIIAAENIIVIITYAVVVIYISSINTIKRIESEGKIPNRDFKLCIGLLIYPVELLCCQIPLIVAYDVDIAKTI
jgi:hypothetical protein